MQLGLDFAQENQYIIEPLSGGENMDNEIFECLEDRISNLLNNYNALKEENRNLHEELNNLRQEKEGLRNRIDSIIGRLEGL